MLPVASILISFAALFVAFQSNNISRETNERSNKISEATLALNLDGRSQEYVETIFSELYSEENTAILDDLRNGVRVEGKLMLLNIIDPLEGVGSSFCQGTVKSRHIKTTLLKTLAITCNNEEIFENFGHEKNGNSILCTEYFPESVFAQTLSTDNLATCDFIDSGIFESNKEDGGRDATWVID